MDQRKKVAIGLGANLSEPLLQIERAADILRQDLLDKAQLSGVYRSAPWGPIKDQPDFLNAVMVGETCWKPPTIVSFLKQLERNMGRTALKRYGPRLIDLDLLLYEEETWESEGVSVPHKGLHERDFVLLPLRELWPEWKHPTLKKRVDELFLELQRSKGEGTEYATRIQVEPPNPKQFPTLSE